MHVALCRISLLLPNSHSLKEKRGVAKRIINRVQSKFGVSVAEIDDNDLWQKLTLGVACVSNNSGHANEVISRVVNFLGEFRGEAEFLDYELEIIHAF